MTQDLKDAARRHFLQASLSLPATSFAYGSTGLFMGMAAMDNAQAAADPNDDYKAIVCCYLSGGSDYANTVVTYDDPSYNKYAEIRGNIALRKSTLVPLKPKLIDRLPNERQYALHPALEGVAGLFNAGKAAVLLNVGPLIQPLTRAQFNAGAPRPPKLFSHNDQSSIWMTGRPEGSETGWGGRLADLVAEKNKTVNNIDTKKLTCISLSGTAEFLSGIDSFPLRLNPQGLTAIGALTETELEETLSAMINDTSLTNMFEIEHNVVTKRSIDLQAIVQKALSKQPLTNPVYNVFSKDGLSSQLKLVARMAAASKALGVKRQIFFVRHGPFDLHDKLIIGQQKLLPDLNNAITAFQGSLESLGMDQEVTLFTASDFGRTLSSNGDGSDHGWGSHHFIVGGSVNGGKFYGKAPPVSVGNDPNKAEDQWHVGNGRLLPSTSVDQLGATLASWFGVANVDLPKIMPNITKFGGPDYPTNLGFMSS